MSDEYLDTTKASDILSKVIAESDIGYGKNRDGKLTPEQEADFIKDTNWTDVGAIYREFKPTRDVIEYTVYFRAPVDGESKKFRCDWEVDMTDLDALGEEKEFTPYIAFALKQACRMTQRWQTIRYRKTGVDPARQALEEHFNYWNP